MKNVKNHIKILSALSIAASDTRRDTFNSVVILTLKEINSCERKELSGYINEVFGFEPYKPELDETVNLLVRERRVIEKKNIISLSKKETDAINSQNIEIRDSEKRRYQNFKNFIQDDLSYELVNNKIKLLWDSFLKYLYNSFYEYGKDAINTLHPHIKSRDGTNLYDNVLSNTIKDIEDKWLKDLLKQTVERFPDFASKEDLNFLDDLAQKTISFLSLGFQADIAQDTIKHDIIDWILYLDTNVLYSLLDLHTHPESDACKALIRLIIENKQHIKVKLRYSDITYKELRKKRADFDLLDDKLTDSSIKALLRSQNLDGFSQKFYERLLKNREGTIHPSDVIKLSQATLKHKTIEIARNAKRIEQLGEDYINAKVQELYEFIRIKNEIKKDFCDTKKIPFHHVDKSEKQSIHDITLRELILESRHNEVKCKELTLNSVKYFCVTLDDILIQFDKSKLKDHNDINSFPVFFKPSFLLNKLVRVLPIQTEDYKKAFIKAITAKGFHKESSKSRDVIKIVNYLKSQGIDDERVVYNIISKDIFLDQYHKESKKEDFNQAEFIESELNREFKNYQNDLTKTKKELASATRKVTSTIEENQKLENKKSILESDVQLYEKELNKLNKRVKNLEKSTPSNQEKINFEAGEAKAEVEQEKDKSGILKKKLKLEIENQIEKEKDESIKSWQRKIWWNLFWVIPIALLALFFAIPSDYNCAIEQSNRFKIAGILIAPIFFIFLYLIKNRYWNEGNIKARKDNHKVSEKLINKLREL
ncbi:MAG: hypothetical protein OXH57_04895, partial [Ekhidna sp.]|nr:hypothetical protein [Ekhidna sp.]